MVTLRHNQRSNVPPSDEASTGARRAQVNAYRDAVSDSPPVDNAVHGDRPPDTPSGLEVPPSDDDAPTPNYSAESIVQLLERLTLQVDDSRLAQEESVASLERRFSSFLQDSEHNQEHRRHTDSSSSPTDDRNDIQQAMQEESHRSDDFRTGIRRPDFRSTPNATPFPASRTSRRQSIMTALSPGPPRMHGTASAYPDDDPPIHNLRGYGAPHRVEYSGPSFHLKPDCPPVCWQLSHQKGPYGGNHDRFMKFQYKLPSDATTELMLMLNFLRTQFQATGFHHGLIPDINDIQSIVDLTKSPVDATIMANREHPEWSNRAHWVNSHRELGFSLHRVLAVVSRDCAASAPVFSRVVSEQSYGGNGFAVLNELLRLHFPHVHGTRAPSFDSATAKKIAQGPSETIPEYEQRFTLWVQSLRLYREFGRYQDSEVTMWFIDGLLSRHQLFLTQEYVDLKQFHSQHRLADDEPPLPDRIQRYYLCERLRLARSDVAPSRHASTPLGPQVALIDNHGVATNSDAIHDSISDANIAALHHRHQHGRGPPSGGGASRGFTLEKAAPCAYAPCQGRSHPPNICCVCDAPTHRVTRCWHILGLPTDRSTRLAAFKQVKQAGESPFTKAQVAALESQLAAVDGQVAALDAPVPSTSDTPFDVDVAEMATDMRSLEAQFHPGYDFPPHSAAIDFIDLLSPRDDDASTSSLTPMPDLVWPGESTDEPDFPLTRDIFDLPSTRQAGGDADTFTYPTRQSFLNSSTPDCLIPLDIANIFTHTNIPDAMPYLVVVNPQGPDGADVAHIAGSESQLIDDSTPPVPIAPVPDEDILPQGNGPGTRGMISYEPPHPPRHGGWWFHVDTGANVHVTYYPDELAHKVHSAGHCGTAGSSSMDVVCEGMWVLQGTPSDCPEFHAVLTALGCPGAKRRSFSLHAMARSGYDCIHHVRSHVEVTHRATNTSYRLSCTTHRETDFIELMPCQAALPSTVYGEINAIDLAKTIKGPALFHLLHLRLGCLGADVLKRMISQRSVQGLPIKVEIPPDFNCPICLRSKSQTASHRPRASLVLNIKGARFHMDFGFFNVPSLRGYQSFLVIVEAVTSYTWVFLRRNKNPPIALWIWFREYLVKAYGVPALAWRTDNGGELWGSSEFRVAVASQHCVMESTGGYNSASNGKAETRVKACKNTTFSLLYMSGLPRNYWCFAIMHATYLLNLRPRSDGRAPSLEEWTDKTVNISDCRVFGSRTHAVIQRKTRANSDLALRTHSGIYLGIQGTPRIILLEDEHRCLRYAHHVVVDELQHDLSMDKRSPASRFLSGQIIDSGHRTDLLRELDSLEVSSDRWLPDNMMQAVMPAVPLATALGIRYSYIPLFGRCRLESFVPGSAAELHLTRFRPLGKILLAINGSAVRTVEDVAGCFRFHLERKQGLDSLTLLLVTMGLGENGPDKVDISPHDHAQCRSIFSIDATSLTTPSDAPFIAHIHRTKGDGTSLTIGMSSNTQTSESVAVVATVTAFDTSRFSIVGSIAGSSDAYLVTPKHWGVAMKSPFKREWLDGLFKHLDSCLQYGTYGLPQVPPSNVVVLPTVLALRNKLDAQNRLDERKVRMCANGSKQIQGLDYDESYAPAILGTTLRVQIALSVMLGLPLWHMDVSNAFQSTPAPVIEGKRIWLRCFPEYLFWLKEKHPDLWKQMDEKARNLPAHLLALEMFKMVQGRVDASRKWQELIEKILMHKDHGLCLTSNRADPCFYTGTIDGTPVLISRATDDLLVSASKSVYLKILTTMKKAGWKMHDKGLASFFFGIRICQSDDGVSIDQAPYAREIVASVLGKDWDTKLKSGTKHSIPLPAGTEFEATLVTETPFDASSLSTAEQKYGFKYRSILCGFMHLGLWTRPDLMPSLIRLSRFQSAPGEAHFKALQNIVLFVRENPERCIMYRRDKSTLSCLHINLEGHHNTVSAITADFTVTCSVAAVIDNAVAMSPEPDGQNLVFPMVDMPSVASLINASESSTDPEDIKTTKSASPVVGFGPPLTEGFVDAGFGSIYETIGFTGALILMFGTAIWWLCKKQATLAYSTTESELYAATEISKFIKWLRVLMADVGLPYRTAIVVGEDNEATRQIGHAGKVTRNVRHVVIQTAALQNDIASMKLALRRVGSSDNRSDHFTKLLPVVPFWTHTNAMMGARFITKNHLVHLGFESNSRNRHLASMFGFDLTSYQAARKLRGMKGNESNESNDSSGSKKVDEGLKSVYPSTHG